MDLNSKVLGITSPAFRAKAKVKEIADTFRIEIGKCYE